MTLVEEVEIEQAKAIVQNAHDWLDYARGEGRFKAGAVLMVAYGLFGRSIPLPPPPPPLPPDLHQLGRAIEFLKEHGIEA